MVLSIDISDDSFDIVFVMETRGRGEKKYGETSAIIRRYFTIH